MNNIINRIFFSDKQYFIFYILIILGVFLRYLGRDYIDPDMRNYLIHWYDYIQNHGVKDSLGTSFTNYTPPYTYILSLFAFLPLQKVISIKLISILMDIVNSFIIYKIIKFKYPHGNMPLLASAIFWCLPTIAVNSGTWGQCDGIYTGFLLLTVYMLILKKPILALLAYGVAFSFKMQSVFLAPLLIILFFRSSIWPNKYLDQIKINWWLFLLVPLTYILLALPTVLLGREWSDVLTVYFTQADTYQWLSAGAPNPYFIIPNEYFNPVYRYGLIFACVFMFLWMLYTVLQKVEMTKEYLLLIALLSVTLSPYLLPSMHERYFYPADVLSLLVAFYMPRYWYMPIAMQIASGIAYYRWIAEAWSLKPMYIALIITTLFILALLKAQKNTKLAEF